MCTLICNKEIKTRKNIFSIAEAIINKCLENVKFVVKKKKKKPNKQKKYYLRTSSSTSLTTVSTIL